MGADGGSINKSTILKLHVERTSNDYKAKDDNLLEFTLNSKWEFCKTSNLPLRLPIVSDYLGNLYNKESVLEWLLCKDKGSKYDDKLIKDISHIKKIHDVIELNNLVEVEGENSKKTRKTFKIKCKYGGDIFGDKLRASFIYCVKCGGVLPRDTLKLISNQNECPICGITLNPDADIIPLNPASQSDVEKLKLRYRNLQDQGLYHDGARIQKRKRDKPTKKPGDNTLKKPKVA